MGPAALGWRTQRSWELLTPSVIFGFQPPAKCSPPASPPASPPSSPSPPSPASPRQSRQLLRQQLLAPTCNTLPAHTARASTRPHRRSRANPAALARPPEAPAALARPPEAPAALAQTPRSRPSPAPAPAKRGSENAACNSETTLSLAAVFFKVNSYGTWLSVVFGRVYRSLGRIEGRRQGRGRRARAVILGKRSRLKASAPILGFQGRGCRRS